jgi:hypothetical protein
MPKPTTRARVLAALAFLALLLAACADEPTDATVVEVDDGSAPPSIGASDSASEAASVEPTAAGFATITLDGTGPDVLEFDPQIADSAIATFTHDGQANFAVQSLAANADPIDLMVNAVGDYSGTTLFNQNEGDTTAALQVDADGAWTVVIDPATSAPAWDGASPLMGTGDAVYRVVPPSSGLATVTLTHEGDENFAVSAYPEGGGFPDLLANEIGAFNGQTVLPDGTWLLEIVADGTWSVTPG